MKQIAIEQVERILRDVRQHLVVEDEHRIAAREPGEAAAVGVLADFECMGLAVLGDDRDLHCGLVEAIGREILHVGRFETLGL